MRTTITRISIFYLGSVAIIVLLLPYSSLGKAKSAAESPFSQVLAMANIPGVIGVIEVVIVLALLSAFNAQIYASSRMMMSLAERRQAPSIFARVDNRGVPLPAIVLSVVLSVIMVILNYVDTGWLLTFLLNAAGASLLTVWTFIAVSQLKLRRRLEALQGNLAVRMWAFPGLTIATLAILFGLAVLMLSDAGARIELLSAIAMVAILFAISLIAVKRPFDKALLPGEASYPQNSPS